MDRIQMCVDSLLEAIREGETYQRYRKCEEKLMEKPELREKIDEFRVAVFRLNNDNGNEYLEAELDVCKMMQRINSRIQGGVDIHIPQV